MGLDKKNTMVIKASKQDEENRYRAFAKVDEKHGETISIEQVEQAEK